MPPATYRGEMDDLKAYLQLSETIPGWTRDDEAMALALAAYQLPADAVIVEVGTFLGSGAVLLAGARKLRGSGKVHCVDPFNGSGDPFSVPHYDGIIRSLGQRPQRALFDENMERVGLTEWIVAHQGTAQEIAVGWTSPIDLLFLDGDQSPAGAKASFEAFSPSLKSGGVLALHNSSPRKYEAEHDGYYLLAVQELKAPHYTDIRLVGSTTFGRKA